MSFTLAKPTNMISPGTKCYKINLMSHKNTSLFVSQIPVKGPSEIKMLHNVIMGVTKSPEIGDFASLM
jgi:hypothetical protein